MEALHKERRFALMLGVADAQGFILKYNTVIDKLIKLENQYKINNPDFNMTEMWNCCNCNGRVKFNLTRQCTDSDLKHKLLNIFSYLS